MKLLFQRDSYYTRAVTCGEVLDVPEKWARTYRAIGHAVEWVDAPPELHMETPERPPTRPTPTPEPPQRPPVQPGRTTRPRPQARTPRPRPGTPRAKRRARVAGRVDAPALRRLFWT